MKKPAILILVALTAALVLTWGVLQWNQAHRRGHAALRRDQATHLIVAALERALSATEADLRHRDNVRRAALTPDSIAVIFDTADVEALPHGRLLYYPAAAPRFASPDVDGLMHTADALRRAGAYEAALARYSEAARMAWASVGEIPTELFARSARCELLASMGRTRELRQEALDLRELLLDGRWRVTKPAFMSHLDLATRWSRAGEPPAADRIALSDIVARLYAERSSWPAAATGSRSTMNVSGMQFTILRQSAGTRSTALIAGPMYRELVWKAQVRALEELHAVRIELIDRAASAGSDAGASQRTAADTRLPWTVQVRSVTTAARQRER